MKGFEIKFSHQCNNNCVFCLNWEKRIKGNSFDLIKKHVKSFAKNGGDRLTVSGGEPLISKHFFDLLVFAKKNGVKLIEILTNGRLLSNEETVIKLRAFEPIVFLVSFHFPNDKLYRRYSKTNGFNQTVAGIKNLIRHDYHFRTTTVVMKPNLAHLRQMIKFLKDLGVKRHQYKFIHGKNVIKDYKKFVPRYKECVPIIKKIINENPDMDIQLMHFPICVVGEELKNKVPPVLSRGRLNLNVKGELATAGEIETQQFVFPNCKNCSYASVCHGVRKEYAEIYGIKEFSPHETTFHKN